MLELYLFIINCSDFSKATLKQLSSKQGNKYSLKRVNAYSPTLSFFFFAVLFFRIERHTLPTNKEFAISSFSMQFNSKMLFIKADMIRKMLLTRAILKKRLSI